MPQPADSYLTFYGETARIHGPWPEIHEWLAFDFSAFLAAPASPPFLDIAVTPQEPPRAIIPELVESMHSPEYVCYDSFPKRYVDYYGRALVVFDYALEKAEMYCADDAPYLYEKLYLLILSRVGERLDKKGLHRVHSLAVGFRRTACLFLMPSRGGKSTLGLALLDDPEVRLMSEDTPLIDRRGNVYPFQLKLAVQEGQLPAGIPDRLVRDFPRERWGTKKLIHLDQFKDRLSGAPFPASYVFVGKWIRREKGEIRPLGKIRAFCTLLRDCVFGLGLPQIVEYFLTTDKKDMLRKSRITLSRLVACCVLACRAKTFLLLLGEDRAENKRLVVRFLSDHIQRG